MKYLFIYLLTIFCGVEVLASPDSVVIPLNRQLFHDRIDNEQSLLDKEDGKIDGMIRVAANEAVNLQVTDALLRRLNEYQYSVETNDSIVSNNEKIRQLNFIEVFSRNFRISWRQKKVDPSLAPLLVDVFHRAWIANRQGASILPFIASMSYEAGVVLTEVFPQNIGYTESRNLLFIKYCHLHPEKILTLIGPYSNEAFADSLIVVACKNDPEQLYNYANSTKSLEGKLIQRNTNPLVKTIVQLSKLDNALLYYPFLDNLLTNKITVGAIKKIIGDGEMKMDSIGYFKLLVKTEKEYYYRLGVMKDTPIAMFGENGLRKMLQRKAIKHFITPINNLHEQNNLNIRMRAIDPLSAEELYYVIVMGENDIYTSSYKHSFTRLLQRMGTRPRGDSLLLNVNMDFFKKFINLEKYR